MLNSSLSSRSDLRGLAYVATAETYSWGSKVYSAGQPCQRGALYVIHEGGCRVSGHSTWMGTQACSAWDKHCPPGGLGQRPGQPTAVGRSPGATPWGASEQLCGQDADDITHPVYLACTCAVQSGQRNWEDASNRWGKG